MTGRMTTVIYQGQTYEIPDIWLAGFCHGTDRTILEGIQWWAYQAELARIEEENDARA